MFCEKGRSCATHTPQALLKTSQGSVVASMGLPSFLTGCRDTIVRCNPVPLYSILWSCLVTVSPYCALPRVGSSVHCAGTLRAPVWGTCSLDRARRRRRSIVYRSIVLVSCSCARSNHLFLSSGLGRALSHGTVTTRAPPLYNMKMVAKGPTALATSFAPCASASKHAEKTCR